jgi:uncharacterized protein YacL
MKKTKVIRVVISVVGAGLGPALVVAVSALLRLMGVEFLNLSLTARIGIFVISAVIFGLIVFFASPAIIRSFLKLTSSIEKYLTAMPLSELIFGLVGLIAGLFVAFLLSQLVQQIPVPWISSIISAFLYVLLGLVGWSVFSKRRTEFRNPLEIRRPREKEKEKENHPSSKADKILAKPKVLDTSVIIDGRIFDICKTGIVEGMVVIPNFVLQELRHIADSADSLKRNRGRRGLDILGKIQKELDIPVRVEEKDYEDIAEVDAKLLKLAQDLEGVVVTNDYNLNKVAAVQGVPVFNINELANAVKPVVLPGEEMSVVIVKEGKELGQGVAYLDDGTMIVVDGGRKCIGEKVDVVVTSVLQTAAGRMIFAKMK